MPLVGRYAPPPMKFGIPFGRLNPRVWVEVALEAERLGFESVWLPEHLVFPVDMAGSPFPGEDHPPVPPDLPVFEPFAYLSFLAGKTETIRLGTHVYNIGLRHPFVAARGIATLDVVSGGRAEIGVGASWLGNEWKAAGLDFASRGRRVDEALEVCIRLWTDDVVEHHGEFFDFDAVMFEPKPVQQPHPPIIVGGETAAALRRAARHDGWIGMEHTPESAALAVAGLQRLREEAGRGDARFEVTVGGQVQSAGDVETYERAGVDRLIVAPWESSRHAIDTMREFAAALME